MYKLKKLAINYPENHLENRPTKKVTINQIKQPKGPQRLQVTIWKIATGKYKEVLDHRSSACQTRQ